MKSTEGFTFWSKYYRAAAALPDKKPLMFYDALLSMGCSGEEKLTGDDYVDSLLEMAAWEVISSHKRVSAGAKGGSACPSNGNKKAIMLEQANMDVNTNMLDEANEVE